MAEKGTGIFLGSTPIQTIQNGNFVFANPFSEAVAPAYQFRSDPYASFIKLAIPGSEFSTLGMSNYYDDVSAGVRGTGTNLTANPSGSASEFFAETETEFPTEGYTTSIFLKDSGGWGTLSNTELNFGTNSFVVEGYVYMDERFTMPPFWKVAIAGIDDSDRIDFGFPGTGTTDTKGRMIINNSQYFSSDTNISYNLNQWYHIAWVRSGSNLYFYFDGTQYSLGTSGNNFDVANMSIMRGSSDVNDGTAGAWQDFRVYIGTDKGYTGSKIAKPASIVQPTDEEGPIKDGLLMYLDAKDYTSGTTWEDQSGNGVDATLVNSPSHTSGDSGYFQLNGTNQLIRIPIGLPPNYTIQIITQSTAGSKTATTLLNCVADGATTSSIPKRDMKWDTTNVSTYAYVTSPDRATLAATYNLNQWYNFTIAETEGTQQGYVDDTQTITNRTSMGTTGDNGDIVIGTGFFGYSNMRVAAVLMYSRELSAAEVEENYNTFSTRY